MQKKAFTLTELLVVVSIVSLLMALVLPSLGKARAQGQRICCLNNLRQLAIAAQTYAQSYDGYYPVAQYRQKTSTTKFEYCWDFTTITKLSTLEKRVVPGLLWQGRTIEEIQQCPAFKGKSNTAGDPYSGYNYNTSYIGHGGGEMVGPSYTGEIRTIEGTPAWYEIVMPAKICSVRRPAGCTLFGDGQYSGGANKYMRAPWQWEGDMDNSLKAAGTQGYRHAEMTNVAWCDGHAGSEKQLYTETVPAEQEKIAHRTGFLSPDNSAYDLQ